MPQDAAPGPIPSLPAAARRRTPVPNAVLATMLIVGMEVMFFTGLLSAFTIVKAGVKKGVWPPPWQPRLPVEVTGVNTLVLIASGVLLFVAASKFAKSASSTKMWMLASMALGAAFVAVQGFEWVQLIGEGLRLSSSNHGAFFYLIVGTHALHCVGGLIALTWVWNRLRIGKLQRAQMTAMQIFWTFVVGLWPLLYTLVYL
jgi:heme/copper-type cytochrome/quinol oxidase subunit 3